MRDETREPKIWQLFVWLAAMWLCMWLLCSPACRGQIVVRGGTGSSFSSSGRAPELRNVAGAAPSPVNVVAPSVPAAPLFTEEELRLLRAWLAELKHRESPQPPAFTEVEEPAEPKFKLQPIDTEKAKPQIEWIEERFLISEPWCKLCPAAKADFLRRGNKAENVINSRAARDMGYTWSGGVPHEFVMRFKVKDQPQKWQQQSTHQRLHVQPQDRYISFPDHPEWGTVDLETWRHCQTQRDGSIRWGRCTMDDNVHPFWQRYQESKRSGQKTQASAVEAFQGAAALADIERTLDKMNLDPETDILCDVGCGDGRWLIAAGRRGVRGVGIDIDPQQVETARAAVAAAGFEGSIVILKADARDAIQFDPAEYGVTAFVAYLHEGLLAELRPLLLSGRIVATLWHEIPGVPMIESDGVFIRRI